MLQHSAFVFQVPRTSHNRVSPFLSSPIHFPFHPNQRAKTRDFLTSFEENNDGDGVVRPRGDEKNYDKDPELAEILGNCLDDPDKAKSRVSFS